MATITKKALNLQLATADILLTTNDWSPQVPEVRRYVQLLEKVLNRTSSSQVEAQPLLVMNANSDNSGLLNGDQPSLASSSKGETSCMLLLASAAITGHVLQGHLLIQS